MGERATIVGARGQDVVGTDSGDVIVTEGSSRVEAGGGDDLICITFPPGRRFGVAVAAGEDDDRVRVARDPRDQGVAVNLGPGNDRFHGEDGDDVVSTPTSGPDGRDVIVTRGGDDFVDTGADGEANADRVDVGDGDDYVSVRSTDNVDLAMIGGDGHDRLGGLPGEPTGAWVVDNQTQTARREGRAAMRWDSFEHINFVVTDDLTFRGSDRDEQVGLWARKVVADMGGGVNRVNTYLEAGMQLSLSGGDGLNIFEAFYETGGTTLTGDLTTQRVVATDGSSEPLAVVNLERFRGLELSASAVNIIGNDRSNFLTGYGCDVSVNGAGADDYLSSVVSDQPDGLSCSNGYAKAVLRGGAGDDVLVGSLRDDILLGGRGRDAADGRRGTDVCRAETKVRCERS